MFVSLHKINVANGFLRQLDCARWINQCFNHKFRLIVGGAMFACSCFGFQKVEQQGIQCRRESLVSLPLPVDYLVSLQIFYIRTGTVSLSGLFWQGLQCHHGAEVRAGVLAVRQTSICQGAWKKYFLKCKGCICSANFSVVFVHDGANWRAPELCHLKAFEYFLRQGALKIQSAAN